MNHPPHSSLPSPENQQMITYLQLLHQFQSQQHTQRSHNSLMDMLMKIAVAICTAGILWLITSVSELQRQMTALTIKQSMTEESISHLNAFAKKPHFTSEELRFKLEPIRQQLQLHEQWLNRLERDK